jgi:hypothetical protein
VNQCTQGNSTALSADSLLLAFINTEFGESNGSAIKDKEALKKMVRDKCKAAPYKFYEHYGWGNVMEKTCAIRKRETNGHSDSKR